MPFDEPFNFSAKVNRGVAASSGELLLFLNDDTELIEPGSIDELAGLALEPGVGLVGAKLLFADGTLQHAGHVYPGLVTHALLGYDGDHPGPNHMALLVRECSGVTAAAAMIRRDRFLAVGGFDEAYPSNFNDVDLSLRLRESGLRNLWTPARGLVPRRERDPRADDHRRGARPVARALGRRDRERPVLQPQPRARPIGLVGAPRSLRRPALRPRRARPDAVLVAPSDAPTVPLSWGDAVSSARTISPDSLRGRVVGE